MEKCAGGDKRAMPDPSQGSPNFGGSSTSWPRRLDVAALRRNTAITAP